jgi:hypothetical protein
LEREKHGKNFGANNRTAAIETHEDSNSGGERGIRTPQSSAENKENPHNDSQRDSQILVPRQF